MRRIYESVEFKGARGETLIKSLIDTGADISLIPPKIARQIGAWRTNQTINVKGIHGQSKVLPLCVVDIFFPSLNNIGGRFGVVVSDTEDTPMIGMDILKLLGITIDTKLNRLYVRNEIWEAFKTLAGVGLLIYGGLKLLETISEEERNHG